MAFQPIAGSFVETQRTLEAANPPLFDPPPHPVSAAARPAQPIVAAAAVYHRAPL